MVLESDLRRALSRARWILVWRAAGWDFAASQTRIGCMPEPRWEAIQRGQNSERGLDRMGQAGKAGVTLQCAKVGDTGRPKHTTPCFLQASQERRGPLEWIDPGRRQRGVVGAPDCIGWWGGVSDQTLASFSGMYLTLVLTRFSCKAERYIINTERPVRREPAGKGHSRSCLVVFVERRNVVEDQFLGRVWSSMVRGSRLPILSIDLRTGLI